MALSVPPSRFTSSVGGGSAFYVRPHSRHETYHSHFDFAGDYDFGRFVFRSSQRLTGGSVVAIVFVSLDCDHARLLC